MSTVIDLVAEILRTEKRLTVDELFDLLSRPETEVAGSPAGLHSMLMERSDLFAWNSHKRLWSVRTQAPVRSGSGEVIAGLGEPKPHRTAMPRPMPPPRPITRSRAPMPLPQPLDPAPSAAGALERELRERLRGRRIVAEVGLDAELHERVEEAIEHLVKPRGASKLANVTTRYPAILCTYLVGHGVYHYASGDYWGSITVAGIDQSFGLAFETALASLGLEGFNDLVIGDRAARYVGPILAHGGIPKYCLDDYFELLLRDLPKVDGDARELLAFWRTRKSSFFNVNQPVRRFLLYAGDLATDFLDRSIDMIRQFEVSDTVGRPHDIGLPPYVVSAFKGRDSKKPARKAATGRRVPRPVIRLDPWTSLGPELELPPVPFDLAGSSWRVQGAGQIQKVSASAHETRTIALQPATAWTAQLRQDATVERETTFEGLDAIPALFFDPATGELITAAAGFRANDVWILGPSGRPVQGVTVSGELSALEVLEELPEPSGAWSGFDLMHVSIEGYRALHVVGDDKKERRVTVRPVAEKPGLAGAAFDRVITDDGLAVYGELPELVLPKSDFGEDNWVVKLGVEDQWSTISAADLEQGVAGRRLESGVSTDGPVVVRVVVQGPLGADLRAEFAFVPDLSVQVPDRLLFPGDAAGDVRISSSVVSINDEPPGTPVNVTVPDAADEVRLTVAAGGTRLTLDVQLTKVMWSVVSRSSQGADMSNACVNLTAADIQDGDVSSLAIRTRAYNLPLQLSLKAGEEIIQVSEKFMTGRGEGRWLFDLGRFAGTMAGSDSPRFSFVLGVGSRPLTVARVLPAWKVKVTDCHARLSDGYAVVDISFDEERPLKDRVVRLWSLDRLWEQAIRVPIPDGERRNATIGGDQLVPAGRYLVELAVDDGWTTAVRPPAGSDNVRAVTVGTPEDINQRLWSVSTDDPLAALEVAVATGRIPRHFEDDELDVVVPAALSSALVMLEQEGSRVAGSREFSAVASIVSLSPAALATAIVDAAESGEASTQDLLGLAIALAERRRLGFPFEAFAGAESSLRSLWEISPAMASLLDLEQLLAGGGGERAREFLGWDPEAEDTEIFVGEPVDQKWIGMRADDLRHIQRMVEVLPKRLLSSDALLPANWEWLLAHKDSPALVEGWWREARTLADPIESNSLVETHFAARQPPTGTQLIARIPQATLGAALHVVRDSPRSAEAARCLMDAAAFAPRLVTRDLVLARLLVLQSRTVPEGP